jgi:PAP2 superfamily
MAGPPDSLWQPAEGPPFTQPSARPQHDQSWLRQVSLNDWIVLAYLCVIDLAVLSSEHRGAARDRALFEVSALLFGFFAVVVVLVRGGVLTHRWLRPLAFRLGHYAGIQLTYFFMRGLLPVVNPGSLDVELHQLGLSWFGVEPALAMQPWVSAGTTEWFAFFYYGYFFVLGLHVFPILFFGRDARLLNEFSLGLLLVLAIGQSMYLVVPGYGPWPGMPQLFQVQLPQGIWWHLVKELVASAGAMKDIFPSIHTAGPSYILLFSFHNRAYLPYRYSWPLVAFFVLNIIIATMFLRWHWLVDIIAGLALALLAFAGSVYGTRWEMRYRAARGLPSVWPEWPR